MRAFFHAYPYFSPQNSSDAVMQMDFFICLRDLKSECLISILIHLRFTFPQLRLDQFSFCSSNFVNFEIYLEKYQSLALSVNLKDHFGD